MSPDTVLTAAVAYGKAKAGPRHLRSAAWGTAVAGPLRFARDNGQRPGTPPAWTRRLLRCGVAAGPVFTAVFLLEGAIRDGYRPLRHPVSSLALGSRGWIQAGSFAVTGTLFLAGAAGLARAGDPAAGSRAAPALIGAAGAGLIASAVFTTDPVSGYPPGTPDALTQLSRTGVPPKPGRTFDTGKRASLKPCAHRRGRSSWRSAWPRCSAHGETGSLS